MVGAHGSIDGKPTEVTCILSLSAPPSSQQEEPLLDQFYRLIHGGAVNSWFYSFTQIPGADVHIIARETATQAMTEGIEEIQLLLQILRPPANVRKSQ